VVISISFMNMKRVRGDTEFLTAGHRSFSAVGLVFRGFVLRTRDRNRRLKDG
jgi:hypothetical protein